MEPLIIVLLILKVEVVISQQNNECNIKEASTICLRCKDLPVLRVLSLNAYANSWFDDLPISSKSEPYDADLVVRVSKQESVNKPSHFTDSLNTLPNDVIIGYINEATKKKERLDRLCEMLNNEKYDFVFLQEIWYEKDYDFLTNCTKTKYNISNYDWDSCGAANEMVRINCSGLVTLSKHAFEGHQHLDLFQGDSRKETILPLYLDHYSQRKVLFSDIVIENCRVRVANFHLSPYYNDTRQGRQTRTKQIEQIIENFGCKWDLAILGMDLNDLPNSEPYNLLKMSGFIDTANIPPYYDINNGPKFYTYFQQKRRKHSFTTYRRKENSWTIKSETDVKEETLDYIFVSTKNQFQFRAQILDFKTFDFKTNNGISISDHSSVYAEISTKCE